MKGFERLMYVVDRVRPVCLILTVTFLFSSGCSSQGQSLEATPIPTDVSSPSAHIPLSEAPVTASPLPAEITPSPAAEPARFVDECPAPIEPNSAATWPSGSILFSRPREFGSSVPDRVYAFDLEKGTLREVATVPAHFFLWPAILSPDGSYLYIGNTFEEPYKVLQIELASGSIVGEFPIDHRWAAFGPWGQSDDVVQLEGFSDIDGEVLTIKLLTLSTQSGAVETRTLQYILPGYRHPALQPTESFYEISQDQTQVIYTAESTEQHAEVDLVLYSLEDEKEQWSHLLRYSLPLPMPSWSPDGSRAAIAYFLDRAATDYDVFLLSNTGDLEPLVTTIPGEDVGTGTWANRLSWSPDGRYLLFRLGRFPIQGGSGFVVDTIDRTMRPLCDNFETQFESDLWLDDQPHMLAFVRSDAPGNETLSVLDAERWQYVVVDTTSTDEPVSPYRPIGFLDFELSER